jgi:hypothetical protein
MSSWVLLVVTLLLATFVEATPAAAPVFIACDGAQALAAHELRR